MNELAQVVLELTSSNSPIEHHPLPADDPTQRRPVIDQAQSVLGWEPRTDLRSGLKPTIDYFESVIA